ncbi:nucleoside triphosphate pyrophosphohydrolase family protein [Vreelandella piezotolerans]|uniref:Pyrophosphatase n=2 Tax=Oceanospirillales TaxID=135619 RepID=A0ABQ6X5Y1_9GAMM|nr:pyrophosphatase [Halomonas piezotolerans]QJA26037.1 nucleoside triphosphate pyrophosphohydrolase family protein [Halomonas piezotolerans]
MSGSIPLCEYERLIKETDRFEEDVITPILLGLYGEVGSIMSASKKYHREKQAYIGYKEAVEEEFGDALWYFTALCRRVSLNISEVFDEATIRSLSKLISANDQEHAPISQLIFAENAESLDASLLELGYIAAQLLKVDVNSDDGRKTLVAFARVYVQALQTTKLSFAKVIKGNVKKTFGRFSKPVIENLPDFDVFFPEEEQLPRYFEIYISERKSGQSYMRWNGVFIGSPLTDNIKNPDGYRFHDVFHFAYAAILHWSPTFRALIKHKRKSDPFYDEAQDSGRAIVVEEGLTAWIYSYSKGLNYFDGHDGVSFDVLKTIQKFIQGYEVEECPLKLWEDAILQGYSVFRKVKDNNGGIVIGDREKRTLKYRAIGEENEG